MVTQKLRVRMRVLDSEREPIGTVKALLDDGRHFRIDCPHARDYYVPREHILAIEGDDVILRVTKRQAGYMGWELKPHTSEK